jgi:alpha-amylase
MGVLKSRNFLKTVLLAALTVLLTISFASCGESSSKKSSKAGLEINSSYIPAPLSNDDDWVTSTNIYQVFVDRFGGNLKGVEAKVPYLKSLGVKTIWLMPIFEAQHDHGYDTTNYYQIASNYGSNSDLKDLVKVAHEAEIRVILDLVLNHCGTQHPWFADSDPNVRKDHWFIWKNSDWGWDDSWNNSQSGYYPNATFFRDPYAHYDRNGNGDPHDDDYYFSLFGNPMEQTMPDLNFNDPTARAEIMNEAESIMKFWIDETGVDGYRCDAVRYLVEEGQGNQKDRHATHDIWQDLRARLTAHAPGTILLAEAPTENWDQMMSYYGYDYWPIDGDQDANNGNIDYDNVTPEFHAAFHFGYQGTLVAAARDNWWPGNLFNDLYAVQGKLPQGTQDCIFLSNHDKFAGDRVATQLDNNTAKIKMASALYLTLSGAPTMYYGEEYGMQNGGDYNPEKPDDQIRQPMDWSEVERQEKEEWSVLNHYKRMLTLRNHYDALRGGITYFTPVYDGGGWTSINSGGKIAAFTREYYGEKIVVIHNFSDDNINAHVDLTSGGSLTIADGTSVTKIMGAAGGDTTATSSNKTWFNVGNVPGKTSMILFLGDISGYVVPALGTYYTYYNAVTIDNTDSWYFRGTPNSWGVTEMTFNAAENRYELEVTFGTDNPRYKISHSGDEQNWSEAYPSQDKLVTDGPGRYLVMFDAASKTPSHQKIIEDTYSISGTVVDDTGAPFSGVTVSAGSKQASTDASGNYTISGLVDGQYTVNPSLPGVIFIPESRQVTISGSNVGDIDFEEEYIQLYTISGTVIDKDGARLADVLVTNGSQSATTNGNGDYTITDVPSGTYQITASKDKYTFEPASRQVTITNTNEWGIDFEGTFQESKDLTVHYIEMGYSQTIYVHTWNGLSGRYPLGYEGHINNAHWWTGVMKDVPDTFSFCFVNESNNWDGTNRHYDRSIHGDVIFIKPGDPVIYTTRP